MTQDGKDRAVERFRFSDVVRATGSTPKSFRRWLVTLEHRSEGDGWHEFMPIEVLQFGLMRQMVDWGVSVTHAAKLADRAITMLWIGSDDPQAWAEAGPPKISERERLKRIGLQRLSLKGLALRLDKHRLYVLPGDDGEQFLALDAPQPWRIFRRKKRPVSEWAWVSGAFLTIDVSYLLFQMAERLGQDMSEVPDDFAEALR